MKIGIITFHWATNYGAVLQSFALQAVLQRMGHDVKIINYKDARLELTPWRFLRNRHFLHPFRLWATCQKEVRMEPFRQRYLSLTPRYTHVRQLEAQCADFDLIVSGSDQVMNPSYLRHISPAYFLGFCAPATRRATYAASFGVTCYPAALIPKVAPLMQRIDAISVREQTGLDIVRAMGGESATVVPDPTLLLQGIDYLSVIELPTVAASPLLKYMLHGRSTAIPGGDSISTQRIEEWIAAIRCCGHLVTNSFHGMVFAILFHVPFTIVLQTLRNEGMNDRFFTLLSRLGLQDRIVDEVALFPTSSTIDWEKVDLRLEYLRQEGIAFLRSLEA